MKHVLRLFIFLLALSAQAQNKLQSSTIGELNVRAIGPAIMGGRITAIEGINREPKILYIGAAGGGLWKTRNGGLTFEPVFDKYPQSVGAIAIDQARPDTVWVGTGESNMRNSVSVGLGIFRTTDAGRTWQQMGLEKSEHISKIIIHPTDPNVLYVAVPGPLWSDSPDRGLYKTVNGGKSWEKILYTDEKTGCADILMDPRNPDVLIAAQWQFRRTPYSFVSGGPASALYKSVDGGKSWRKLTEGLPDGEFGRIALAQAPSKPDHLLAIVESKETGLYISTDAGEHWKRQSATMNVTARPFYFSTLVIDPKDPNRVYRPAFSLSISSDGGYSFADLPNDGGWVHSDHHALWINPNNTDHLYLGTDGGVYMSIDKGVSWSHLNSLPVSQFYHITTDNQKPYYVYGGLQDNGSWRGPSNSPGGIGNRDWEPVGGGDGFWVQPDDQDPAIIFCESQGGNIERMNLHTNQSVSVKPENRQNEPLLRWNWNTPIVKHPARPGRLFMGAQFLYQSDDRGRSWMRISPDLTTNDTVKQKQYASGGLTLDNSSAENHCTIFAIAPSPVNENLIYAGTDDGNIQITRDGGKNWELISKNIPGLPAGVWVSSLEASRFDQNTVFATFDNHAYGDMKTYAARSNDQGRTWQLLTNNNGPRGFAHVIRQDIQNPDLLFLGTELGLFLSNDGGKSWILYKSGLPEYAPVRDLAIQPATNDLVIATHGRGVYILDDISPLRLLTPDLLQQAVVILPGRPQPVSIGHYGLNFPVTDNYTAGNAIHLPTITYYLKDRIMSGDVTIEILDPGGKLIVSLPGTKRKGLNLVRWDMRLHPPHAAKGGMVRGEVGIYAGFVGQLAAPGVYTIRLKAGDQTAEGRMELIPDPLNPNLNYAERRSYSDRAFTLVERFGLLNEQLHALQDTAAARVPKVKNKTLQEKLKQYSTAVRNFRETLLFTEDVKGISIEDRLRSFIGRLYVNIESIDELPTQSMIDRLTYLESEMNKTEATAKQFLVNDREMLSKALTKEKLPGLPLLDKTSFEKSYNTAALKGGFSIFDF